MTALTNKQRVKVNAALTLIHAEGGNASAVTARAKALQGGGQTAAQGYQTALNEALSGDAALSNSVGRVMRLIEASDDATEGVYDRALASYNQSGDEAALEALAPMMARDSAALAIRTGEMTHADIGNGGLANALGFEPDAAMIAAAMELPASGPAPSAAPSVAPPSAFAFTPPTAPPAQGGTPGGIKGANKYAGSPFPGAAGYSVPKTGVALARQVGLPMAYVKAQAEAQATQ